MKSESPLAVTISRQVGSGGAFLGQRLAVKFRMLYLDKEIINKAAGKLGLLADDLESRDERALPRWQTVVNSLSYAEPGYYTPPVMVSPTDREIYKAEAEIISKVAREKSAVIIGRGGSYILRDHPRHVSIYLHADMEFRKRRIQELYHVSPADALKYIESTDKYRMRYLHKLTGRDMNDARQYHLSIDTGILGLGQSERLILDYLDVRFGKIE